MENIENKVEQVNKDVDYFERMINGTEKLMRPDRIVKIALIIALVLSNLVWGGVHGYAIYKAYQEPTTYEQGQNQKFDDMTQEQNNKGSVS